MWAPVKKYQVFLLILIVCGIVLIAIPRVPKKTAFIPPYLTPSPLPTEPSYPPTSVTELIHTPTAGMSASLTKRYKVTHVVDGDTIDVQTDQGIMRVRMIGINTPESVDPRRPVQCFGREASDKTKSILSGISVRLESDPTQDEYDKYDRLLRYVFLPDGSNFNKMLISEGYAHEYTYNVPYLYQTEFKQAERDAKRLKKGLWADGVCDNT